MNAQDVLHFWFKELSQPQWFAKDKALDTLITEKFGKLHEQAAQCELWSWRASAFGRLAEIILLDQFSRNIYRDSARAFATDALCLALAQEAISVKADQELTTNKKAFLYMPFMHSESLLMQEKSVELFSLPGLEHNLDFAIRHKEIIDRFGRYPHRNDILGRPSTLEEVAFLKQPGSSF